MLLQSCLTLGNPVDCGLPDSSVCGILRAGTLEWVAISFSRRWLICHHIGSILPPVCISIFLDRSESNRFLLSPGLFSS